MGSPFWFFQVYCTIIKTYSGWFVNCVLFKSSHIKNAKKATRASAFVVDTLAALLFIPLWYAIQHTHTDAGSLKGYLRSFLSVFLQSPKRQAVQRNFLLCQVAKYKKFFLVRRAIAPISQQVSVVGIKKFNFSLTYDPVFLPQAYHRFVEAINRIRITRLRRSIDALIVIRHTNPRRT